MGSLFATWTIEYRLPQSTFVTCCYGNEEIKVGLVWNFGSPFKYFVPS